jgi:Thymidine kinase
MTTAPGRIEVITGPMFSGKSEELIRRLKRAKIARQRVACYKPDIDLRYHRTAIASHSSQTHDATTVATVEELKARYFRCLMRSTSSASTRRSSSTRA